MLFNKYNLDLEKFTDKKGVRSAIQGIFINAKESVATNNFYLIRVDRAKGNIENYPAMPNKKAKQHFPAFILPRNQISDVLNLLKGKSQSELPILDNVVITQASKEGVEISRNDLESVKAVQVTPIQENYPDYKEIVGQKKKCVKIEVNAEYLKAIADYFKDFIDEPNKVLKISVPEQEGFISFEGRRKDGQTADAYLMPVKTA